MKQWSNISKIVYRRTYSRNDSGIQELWLDTCKRVIEGNIEKYKGTEYLKKDEEERLMYYMLNRKAMPAGRGLWFSGTEAHRKLGGMGLNNCAATAHDEWINLIMTQDYLMLGSGMGGSVEHRFVSKLPKVKKDVEIYHKRTADADFIVADSREGWNELTHKVFEAFFVTGKGFSYSTIVVRGANEDIKGFGGKSSGPAALIELVEVLCAVFKSREGRHLRPIDMVDVKCAIGRMVISGNVRRSALILQGDPWDKEYLKAKRWDLGTIPSHRAQANFSVVCSDVDDLHPLFWKTYEHGEPFGIINRKNIQTYGRMGERKVDRAIAVNPCLTGDTLIALADGRGELTIKQLSDEGKDVNVYCLDNEGKLLIRTMRNPRLTGSNREIYKVTFDDGSTIRATGNHKLRLKGENSYKRVDELVYGDSIELLTKSKASFNKTNKNASRYALLSKSCFDTNLEHRIIYQHFNQVIIPRGFVIHHKDHNSENNSPNNLEMMTKADHDHLHSFDMLGDKNPMRRAKTEWSEEKWVEYRRKHRVNGTGESNPRFSGYSNKDLYKKALQLTKSLGRRFSTEEWDEFAKKNDLPQNFSGWRKENLGSVRNMAIQCALELGFENAECDPRVVKTYKTALSQGYNALIIDKSVVINKSCENCSESFTKTWESRETSYCSDCYGSWGKFTPEMAASNKNPEHIERRRQGIIKTCEAKKEVLRDAQVKIYSDLKFELKRDPYKKEWQAACKKLTESFEISRKSSPFTSYSDLKEAASAYNHKVISVELDGEEDVYNGTVDEFHNFFAMLEVENDRKSFYINNKNCGELPLESGEICNLQELFLPNLESVEEFKEAAILMHRWGKRVTNETYHNPITDKIVKRNRRIGTGITGCMQSDLFEDEILDEVYAAIQEENVSYSKQMGINESIRTTTVKPSGTLSILGDCSAGIHPSFSKYYIRRVRFAENDKLVPILREAGHPIEYVKELDGTYNRNTVVGEFYCETPEGTPTADSGWDTWKQLEVLKKAQKHWADNAVSVTVYYKKDEIPLIKDWLRENLKEIKSISFLCHDDHGFEQAPLEAITKEQYEKAIKGIKTIEDTAIQGGDLESMECDSRAGSCPIK